MEFRLIYSQNHSANENKRLTTWFTNFKINFEKQLTNNVFKFIYSLSEKLQRQDNVSVPKKSPIKLQFNNFKKKFTFYFFCSLPVPRVCRRGLVW